MTPAATIGQMLWVRMGSGSTNVCLRIHVDIADSETCASETVTDGSYISIRVIELQRIRSNSKQGVLKIAPKY